MQSTWEASLNLMDKGYSVVWFRKAEPLPWLLLTSSFGCEIKLSMPVRNALAYLKHSISLLYLRRNRSWTRFIVYLAWRMQTTCYEYSIFRRLVKCTRSLWVTVLCVCNRFCHSGSEDETYDRREVFQNIFHKRCTRALPPALDYELISGPIIWWKC